MTRIAVGGFLHETNTFAPTKATYDDFVHGGGWPAMTQGADVLKLDAQHQCRARRFHRGSGSQGLELVPTIFAAQARGACHKDAFERIVKVMVDGLARPARSMRSISTCTAPW